jgi:uncharacterized protein (TIGR03083 family)
MTSLTRTEISDGLLEELDRFEQLVRSLDATQWNRPTRCEGWTVADVAAHVVGIHADIAAGKFDGLGSQETIDRQVAERRGRTQQEIADELEGLRKAAVDLLAGFDDTSWQAPGPAGVSKTVGFGVEGLWYDAYVHNEDIRAAAGLPSEAGPGLRASVFHVAGLLEDTGWGPATLALDGVEEVPVGTGGEPTITGDPLPFVLVATGREDPSTIGLDETVNVYRAT